MPDLSNISAENYHRTTGRQHLKIFEESYKTSWAAITVFAFLVGALLLQQLQYYSGWLAQNGMIILTSGCFALGIWGLYKLIEKLYVIEFILEDEMLYIKVFRGENLEFSRAISLRDIAMFSFSYHEAPGPYDALYDFSSNYIPVIKKSLDGNFELLIDLEASRFTFKIQDIKQIADFLLRNKSDIEIPQPQRSILNL